MVEESMIFRQTPSPGAVCPAIVINGFSIFNLSVNSIVPDTSNIILKMAIFNYNGEFFRLVWEQISVIKFKERLNSIFRKIASEFAGRKIVVHYNGTITNNEEIESKCAIESASARHKASLLSLDLIFLPL